MASIRKRGGSYLLVVSMGYDYEGKRIRPKQKTVHPPEELSPKQKEKWLNEQAVLFERSCRDTPKETAKPITLAAYIDLWLREIAPGKLAKSTIRQDRQDIVRILDTETVGKIINPPKDRDSLFRRKGWKSEHVV